jgi:hypothetical protein
MQSCHCTNQCVSCGACCRSGCAHRASAGGMPVVAAPDPLSPFLSPWTRPPSYSPPPLTEERVRHMVREEMDAALERVFGRVLQDLVDPDRFPQYRNPDAPHG